MKRAAVLLSIVMLILAGCDQSEEPKLTPPGEDSATLSRAETSEDAPEPDAAAQDASPEPAEEEQTAAMTAKKTDLVFFNEDAQQPSFTISAPRFSLLQDSRVWVLEKANAVIYGEDGQETIVKAGKGRFNDEDRSAILTDGAEVLIGDKVLKLAGLIWRDEERVAKSDDPLSIKGAGLDLKAATMRFLPDTESLLLTGVTGSVAMGDGEAQEGAATGLAFVQPAPEVEFIADQLDHISGGVAVTLDQEGAEGPPMELRGEAIRFAWGEGASPREIVLERDVKVTSAQGTVESDKAVLDTAKNTATFTGNVKGDTEQIASFSAERIFNDIKANTSVMTGLSAKGIALEGGGYSSMDVDRAGQVELAGGQVKRLHGGVNVMLRSAAPKAKPMKLGANEMSFVWGGSGSPQAIKLRGNVRVDGDQGTIAADNADFNVAKKMLVFTGNVSGKSDDIPHFEADRIEHDTAKDDLRMANLRAEGLPLRKPADPDAAPKGMTSQSYDTMDITKAPEVFMEARRFKWIKGGVELQLRAEGADKQTTMTGDEMHFTFASPTQSQPERIELVGHVTVVGPDIDIEAERAVWDMVLNMLTFSGGISGDLPNFKGVLADDAAWNLDSGNVTLSGWRFDEEIRTVELKQAGLLSASDILDWPKFIAQLKAQAQGEVPSPGRRIAQLLDAETRTALATLPTDQELDEKARGGVVKRLNELLEQADFYEAASWASTELDAKMRAALEGDRSAMDTAAIILLNRRAFEAAFPGLIKPVREDES